MRSSEVVVGIVVSIGLCVVAAIAAAPARAPAPTPTAPTTPLPSAEQALAAAPPGAGGEALPTVEQLNAMLSEGSTPTSSSMSPS
jgi:hypothetical protein